MPTRARLPCIAACAAVVLCAPGGEPAAAQEATWPLVGRQGLLQVVIVPKEQAADLAAYRAQIPRLCAPDTTCFINFFTNTAGAVPALPLPDAIAAEATARFRRSTKNGVEVFQWSCRMGTGTPDCF